LLAPVQFRGGVSGEIEGGVFGGIAVKMGEIELIAKMLGIAKIAEIVEIAKIVVMLGIAGMQPKTGLIVEKIITLPPEKNQEGF